MNWEKLCALLKVTQELVLSWDWVVCDNHWSIKVFPHWTIEKTSPLPQPVLCTVHFSDRKIMLLRDCTAQKPSVCFPGRSCHLASRLLQNTCASLAAPGAVAHLVRCSRYTPEQVVFSHCLSANTSIIWMHLLFPTTPTLPAQRDHFEKPTALS